MFPVGSVVETSGVSKHIGTVRGSVIERPEDRQEIDGMVWVEWTMTRKGRRTLIFVRAERPGDLRLVGPAEHIEIDLSLYTPTPKENP